MGRPLLNRPPHKRVTPGSKVASILQDCVDV